MISHLNGNLGVGGNILTSYANAGADAGDTLGISGSLNNFIVHNNTTAWVATSANLNATCTVATCGSGAWSANLNTGTQAFDATLAVTASSYTASIDAAGNVGTLGFLPGNTSGGSSFGGSLNLVQISNNTIAGVAANATVSSTDNISVEAVTTDQFFGVAPTSGKAAGSLALNGITSMALLDNTTHASIGAGATVSAPTVNIYAAQDLSMLSIAGAVSLGANSAVGLAVAYLGATADTAAYIGDNGSDIRSGAFSTDDPFSGTGGGTGSVRVDNLIISATTSGRITAASVAAAISEPSVSSFATKAGAVTAAATGGTDGVVAGAAKAGSTGSSTSGFSIDLAGSSSVSDVSLATSAYIKNAGTIDKFTTAHAVNTNTIVQALNDTVLDNGSGSAAANMAGSAGSNSAAVGGAIASATSNNATSAYIYGTTLNNQNSVTVQALNGGSETVVALGIAGSNANAASLSASVGIITDSANAYIESSTITGQSTGINRALEVDAYQTANIAIGGGALFYVWRQGRCRNRTDLCLDRQSHWSEMRPTRTSAQTSISNYDTLLVLADNASVIAAGAASGGAATNGNSLAGAIVVDEISPTTTAYIDSGATVSISVGSVTVMADSGSVSDLDTALGNLVKKSNSGHLASDTCTAAGGSGVQNCIDFGAAALNGGTSNGPGGSIVSVAGVIQAVEE